MTYEYEYVLTLDGSNVVANNGDYVILSLTPIPDVATGGGGGKSLTDLDKYVRIPFRIEVNVDGIKAFTDEQLYKVIGVISHKIFSLYQAIGIIAQKYLKEISTTGISSKLIDECLELSGIKAHEILVSDDIKGIISQELEAFDFIKGITSSELEMLNSIEGVKAFTKEVLQKVVSTKNIPVKLSIGITGKRDIRKIILSLMNLE